MTPACRHSLFQPLAFGRVREDSALPLTIGFFEKVSAVLSTMKQLNYDLKLMTDHNVDGSHKSIAARKYILQSSARQLDAMGFKNMRATSLKTRHVQALVDKWQADNISIATIKNRMTHLRWWAKHIGKRSIIPNSNAALGIGNRCYVPTESKAKIVVPEVLATISDPYVRMSLELQAAFGLRREEAIKFQPGYADKGNNILAIKDTWAKGKRAREIPIRTAAQREVLDRAHQLAGNGSMIPSHLLYKHQVKQYEGQTQTAGLSKLHGLRHAYAQARYQELTGWPAPLAGGPSRKELTPEQRDIDRQARLEISQEMGHGRIQIMVIYLSR